jgi:hypothetical protein
MFFAGLIIFIACSLYLPWYAATVVALFIGLSFRQASLQQHLSLAVASGIAYAACAFMADGRNYGLISRRMSGLFMLPSPYLLFAVLFMISFISVLLWLRFGFEIRRRFGQ